MPRPTRIALVRRPGPRLSDGIVTHIDRSPIDLELAMKQWTDYVDAVRDTGWRVVEVPPADDCPDAVFVEDPVVMYRGTAIITRPGDDARKPETVAVEPVVAELGCRIERIVAPGTMDGGDVLKVPHPDGDTIYVGLGGRTNPEGLRQFAAIVEPMGARVVGVPLSKVLHLKSAATALSDGTIVGWEPGLDSTATFPRFEAVSQESGAHVVLLEPDLILMAADAPEMAASYRARGYRTIEVDISEFIKLEGCVTCLSVRVRELP
ncbi:MAG: N(G),N(G)-dimethylarginine dimethylaminohydrolase [Ilumatobacteraceae bacterium]|nr:N(G),N(G)-dimethylarginine dimethylaminohydrolase [Ilumatobacteraceae bacterium]